MKGLLLLFGSMLVLSRAAAFAKAPPISITSPDQGSTYVFASIKDHQLIWDKRRRELVAHVVFQEYDKTDGPASDDEHDFRLPGVRFDPATGIFSATSAKGKVIPVARLKKSFLFSSIETLPNAVVRVVRLGGNVSVVLEAISPDDPALRAPPAGSDGSGDPRAIDISQLFH